MKWIISAGGLLVALTTVLTFWSTYGWITRTVYADDHKGVVSSAQIANIENLLLEIKHDQDLNRDQWECDEMDEEIPELKKELAEAVSVSEQIDIERDIEKQQERWVKLDCSQFTE